MLVVALQPFDDKALLQGLDPGEHLGGERALKLCRTLRRDRQYRSGNHLVRRFGDRETALRAGQRAIELRPEAGAWVLNLAIAKAWAGEHVRGPATLEHVVLFAHE